MQAKGCIFWAFVSLYVSSASSVLACHLHCSSIKTFDRMWIMHCLETPDVAPAFLTTNATHIPENGRENSLQSSYFKNLFGYPSLIYPPHVRLNFYQETIWLWYFQMCLFLIIFISFSPKFVHGVQLTISHDWCLVTGLALNRFQAITWTNDDPVHRYISTSSGLIELINNRVCHLGKHYWNYYTGALSLIQVL